MNFIRSGFRAIRDNHGLAFAEIAWRWAFGAVAWLVLAFAIRQILAGIDINPLEATIAHSSDAILIADAISRILVQVLPRFVHALGIVIPLLALVWIVTATVGRAVTLRPLLGESGGYGSLLLLNCLRAFFAVATFVGFFGTAYAVSAATAPDLSSGAGPALVLAWMFLALLVGLLWGIVNWFLALAPIFALRDGSGAWGAIGQSLSLYRERPREYLAIATSFGLFRGAAMVFATLAGFVVVASGGVRAAIILSIVVALAYFALADILYIARLASYVGLANNPTPSTALAMPAQASATPARTPYTETETEI
jgi:hypothetical protein